MRFCRPGQKVPSLILSSYRDMDQGPPREETYSVARQVLPKLDLDPDQTSLRLCPPAPEQSRTCWHHQCSCQGIRLLINYCFMLEIKR